MAKKKSNRRVTILDPAEWPEDPTRSVNSRLLQACILRHVPIARRALSNGADVNCRSSDYLTPLHIAVKHDDIDLIQLLCDQPSVDIESKTTDGLTPLHTAAFLGHEDAITKLIEYGANVNCTNNLGRRPLHYTSLRDDTNSATILLTNNANVNACDAFDESPLYTNVIRRPSFYMIKLLLSYGASVSLLPRHNSLGLILEAVLFARDTSDMRIFDFLFQNDAANLNITDSIGLRTPLHIVAMTGNLKLATYLIEKGADLSVKNRAGLTPMEVAIAYRNLEIARLIDDWLSRKLDAQQAQSSTDPTNN